MNFWKVSIRANGKFGQWRMSVVEFHWKKTKIERCEDKLTNKLDNRRFLYRHKRTYTMAQQRPHRTTPHIKIMTLFIVLICIRHNRNNNKIQKTHINAIDLNRKREKENRYVHILSRNQLSIVCASVCASVCWLSIDSNKFACLSVSLSLLLSHRTIH